MKPTPRALLFLSIGLAFLITLHTLSLAQDKPDFAALKGRWVRTNDGYVVKYKRRRRRPDAGHVLQSKADHVSRRKQSGPVRRSPFSSSYGVPFPGHLLADP